MVVEAGRMRKGRVSGRREGRRGSNSKDEIDFPKLGLKLARSALEVRTESEI